MLNLASRLSSLFFVTNLPVATRLLLPLKTACIIGAASKMASASEVPRSNIILYIDPVSFYSQKVVLAFHEKHVPFTKHSVDLMSNENYSDWFLKLNPLGEVPVINDNDAIIPDSKKINDYLEKNYSQAPYTSLMPTNEEAAKKVEELRNKVDEINGNTVVYGIMYHREHISNPKFPFNYGFVLSNLRKMFESMGDRLRDLAEKRPEIKDFLLQKASRVDSVKEMVQNKNLFQLELNKIAAVLEEMEKQLLGRTPEQEEWWLVSEKFTLADVSLTVLMYRLSAIGLEEYMWGALPHLQSYYQRVQKRQAYKETFPTAFGFFKDKIMGNKCLTFGTLAATAGVIGAMVLLI